MKIIINVFLAAAMMFGLVACDEKIENNANTQNTVANKATFLNDKLEMSIPGYFKDQAGLLENQTTGMTVYADNVTQQTLTVFLSDAEGNDVETLIEALARQYQNRDSASKLVIKDVLALNLPVSAWRFDVISRIQGKEMYSSIVMMVIDDQLVTIQFVLPNEAGNKPTEIVNDFIKTIQVKP